MFKGFLGENFLLRSLPRRTMRSWWFSQFISECQSSLAKLAEVVLESCPLSSAAALSHRDGERLLLLPNIRCNSKEADSILQQRTHISSAHLAARIPLQSSGNVLCHPDCGTVYPNRLKKLLSCCVIFLTERHLYLIAPFIITIQHKLNTQ